ncbi:MAG: hypothetical protein FJX44_00035 [Alphaproteobacteria bacterium]|nr:hypothetical protein [Alphaproteobacteria bacterium]
MTPHNIYSYFTSLAVGCLAPIAVVGWINYSVDNEGFFGPKTGSYGALVERLFRSQHGITITQGDVRFVKLAMIERSRADCYINGSSHQMEFNSHNWPAAAAYGCKQLSNIGVYYSAYEDAVIQIDALLKNPNFKTLFLAMDPWIFRKNKTRRYEVMAPVHMAARTRLGLPHDSDEYKSTVPRASIYTQVLNFSYFRHNLRALLNDRKTTPAGVEADEEKREGVAKREIFNSDGSRVRPIDSYNKLVGRGRYFDAGNIKPPFISEDVVSELKIILQRVKAANKQVAFILTPYSPQVWECKGDNERSCLGLREVEAQIEKLADELGIDIFGSYRPEIAGVNSDEFLDGHHMSPTAFQHIKLTRRPKHGSLHTEAMRDRH